MTTLNSLLKNKNITLDIINIFVKYNPIQINDHILDDAINTRDIQILDAILNKINKDDINNLSHSVITKCIINTIKKKTYKYLI